MVNSPPPSAVTGVGSLIYCLIHSRLYRLARVDRVEQTAASASVHDHTHLQHTEAISAGIKAPVSSTLTVRLCCQPDVVHVLLACSRVSLELIVYGLLILGFGISATSPAHLDSHWCVHRGFLPAPLWVTSPDPGWATGPLISPPLPPAPHRALINTTLPSLSSCFWVLQQLFILYIYHTSVSGIFWSHILSAHNFCKDETRVWVLIAKQLV